MKNLKNLLENFAAALGGLSIVVFATVILGFPTKWLWNWLMPSIFGLKEITFWQAIGLQILAYLILPRTSSSKSEK
jgi:hypothetical protein